jgi:hypothetical protein
MTQTTRLLAALALSLSACGDSSEEPSCGDGELHYFEICDGSNLRSATCESVGRGSGILACTAQCTLDTSGCACDGDGVAAGTEECDGSDVREATCESALGAGMIGNVSCLDDCTLDLAGCSKCGNGVLDPGEDCEGAELDGATCESLGGDPSGALSCDPLCALDSTGCYSQCFAECTEDSECSSDRCVAGTCVGLVYAPCTDDAECDLFVCHLGSGQCRMCNDDTDCRISAWRRCGPDGFCHACLDDSHCEDGRTCVTGNARMWGWEMRHCSCASNADCDFFPGLMDPGECDDQVGTCGTCVTDADCRFGRSRCLDGACVCKDDTDCESSNDGPICTTSGYCTCSSDSECGADKQCIEPIWLP